jgi:hypothetical protein
MKLAILNTSIVTSDGEYTVRTISEDEAISYMQLVAEGRFDGIDSAVGHPSTAQILTTILGVQIPVNNQLFAQQIGQYALVFKLNGRPKGQELSRAELEEIGFTFKILKRIS